ncbi:MAG: hypothetical protein A2038_00160 [Deltaproteobacteria bacterium GWA2_57_13]|nr:MAG: hypothetical protein A2038_00160 [Deltaproteobacteria bacterium GWA2_57_13]OGQ80336.1 MAG: hypothetical protein A3G40_00370 [Deltaproteobacteria bacterium RIFCSPLOWO2_12_FULL_57_22]
MQKLKLYVETSLFGFYFDRSAANRTKMNAVTKLFQQIKEGLFEGYVSGLVRAELQKAPPPYRGRFLRLIDRYSLKAIDYDQEEAGDLHLQYMEAGVVPQPVADDAAHVAIATVGGMDVVVSCNLRHLANELAVRRFQAVNLRQGYGLSLSIRQPEEVIFYED